ncbi:thymidylate synthase [Patescibacteria group bacterium]|nr:thymidylate synthase [Patescibacteria group bacterium]MBU1246519.1 thymidylate synthase [Patescibacteria group bacterium]MBU1519313.1 thymidylate synthase [Patescibacteria group bacterium]MBU1730389.1 thymidylate synthase [Patescibacteria group bacterium]MBU1956472.1 thymidylate synthase [Patescibacteria group bacterium]
MSSSKQHPEYQYLDLLKDIMENGVQKKDHNSGMGLTSVFGRQLRFDLSQGFPLLTTRKIYWKGILHELYWFLSGQSNIKYLVDNDVHIWDDYPYKIYNKKVAENNLPELAKKEFIEKIKTDEKFAKEHGELPFIYGQMWRSWPARDGRKIDQLAWIVDTIKNFPDRKHTVLSVWNPEHLYSMALPGQALSFPLCHIFFHFNVSGDRLSCQLYQRSADIFLGVPFNIGSYALLTILIARLTGYKPGDFVHTFGDVHIYNNHLNSVNEQITREPQPFPTVKLDPKITDLNSIKPEYIALENYNPHPTLYGDLTIAGGFNEKDRKKFYPK